MTTTSSTGASIAAWDLDEITVRRVDETNLPLQTGPWLLPAATKEVIDEAPWLRPDFASDVPHLASHTFAVEAGDLKVIVDTGIGNYKDRSNPAWDHLDTDYFERLTAAGFDPGSVDLVINTHLHTDHVGWNTRLENGQWVPTFPRARYVVSRTEWDYWTEAEMDDSRRQMFRDSVYPIRDSGQFDLRDVPGDGLSIAPGIRLVGAPGHTPGQVAVELRGHSRTALITGDSIHHPVQLSHPHVTSCADIDPGQAHETRARLLERVAGTGTLLLGTHFPKPTAGTVHGDGEGYRLLPEPGTGHAGRAATATRQDPEAV